jgi:hypothetical protein
MYGVKEEKIPKACGRLQSVASQRVLTDVLECLNEG